MRVAIVCSAHGLGHTARQLALAEALLACGAAVTFLTAAPDFVTTSLAGVMAERWVVDVGIAQRDSVTEDLERTRSLLAERCDDVAIDRLATRLTGFDRVVVDVAPAALEAARRAEVSVLAVGNFDWAWIYDAYPTLADWAARFRDWQAPHTALELSPGPGMTGFAAVERFGPLGRTAAPAPLPAGSVLVSFGGFGLDALGGLLPEVPGVTWWAAAPTALPDRADCRTLPTDLPYAAAVAGADVVFTKPGYGILVEAMLGSGRLVWVPRGAFPESASLAAVMADRGDLRLDAPLSDAAVFRSALAAAVRRRMAAPRPDAPAASSAGALAARVLA